jgi:hypothetical protein
MISFHNATIFFHPPLFLKMSDITFTIGTTEKKLNLSLEDIIKHKRRENASGRRSDRKVTCKH